MGGAEIVVKKSADYLARRGNEVIIITTSQNGYSFVEDIDGIKVYRIHNANITTPYNFVDNNIIVKLLYYIINLWSATALKNIKRILLDEKPDIVHMHNYKGLSLSSFRAVKSLDIPTVFTVHDHFLICPYNSLLKGSGRICYNRRFICKLYSSIQKIMISNTVDVLISPSAFLVKNLNQNRFFLNTKTYILPLGIEKSPCIMSKDYEIIELLFVGSIGKPKGVDTLIKAFMKLNGHNLRLSIVGKGQMEQELRDMSCSDNRITFYGFVHPHEITQFYQKANLLIVPSICYDNSPMVIYESLANGTPVIGSKIGGIPELIEDGYNGFTFFPGNVDELVDILKYLINDVNELKKIQLNSYESSKKFSIDNYIDKLEQIYGQLHNQSDIPHSFFSR